MIGCKDQKHPEDLATGRTQRRLFQVRTEDRGPTMVILRLAAGSRPTHVDDEGTAACSWISEGRCEGPAIRTRWQRSAVLDVAIDMLLADVMAM